MQNFCDFLAGKVRTTGLSQRQFASAAGITQGSLSRILKTPGTLDQLLTAERGKKPKIRNVTIQGIAMALGTSTEAFIALARQHDGGPATLPDGGLPRVTELIRWLRQFPMEVQKQVVDLLRAQVEAPAPPAALAAIDQAGKAAADAKRSSRTRVRPAGGRNQVS